MAIKYYCREKVCNRLSSRKWSWDHTRSSKARVSWIITWPFKYSGRYPRYFTAINSNCTYGFFPDGPGRLHRQKVAPDYPDVEYEVKAVVNTRIHRIKRTYLVTWQDRGSNHNTWVNENRIQAPEAIEVCLEATGIVSLVATSTVTIWTNWRSPFLLLGSWGVQMQDESWGFEFAADD